MTEFNLFVFGTIVLIILFLTIPVWLVYRHRKCELEDKHFFMKLLGFCLICLKEQK